MARQRRIEFKGAFYHVTSRGNRKSSIFLEDGDRYFFLNCLRDAHDKYGIVVMAYCLMENHFHLFLQTPQADLSKAMHFINTAYTVFFNRKHRLVGHPFQGRYKAVLVQAETHALEIVAYIHLNPVRAKLTEHPEQYRWSNYREYVGLEPARSWTSSDFVLRRLGASREKTGQAYRGYVLQRIGRCLQSPLDAARQTGILGDEAFVEQLKRQGLIDRVVSYDRELPQANKLAPQPSLEDIKAISADVFGPNNRYARKAAIFLSHRLTRCSLREIGAFFQIGVSGVTDICRRMRRESDQSDMLSSHINEIEERIRMKR